MKKLISIIGLTTAIAAFGQQHISQDLLTVRAIQVSNTFNITNLSAPISTWGSNQVGTIYTNGSGVQVIAAAGNRGTLLGKVALWVDRNGLPTGPLWATNNQTVLTTILPVNANISGSIVGGSGADTAVQFVFGIIPASDGSHNPDINTVLTDPLAEWRFGVLPLTSQQNFVTNVPTWLWPGCRGLVLKRVINADPDATSQVGVWNFKLNGFIP